MQGLGISPGISIGRASVVRSLAIAGTGALLKSEPAIREEIDKYHEAVRLSTEEIRSIVTGLQGEGADILETHIELLNDAQLEEDVIKKIRGEKKNAVDAVLEVVRGLVETFYTMEDEYLKARAADIQDIGNRICRHLSAMPPGREKKEEGMADASEDTPGWPGEETIDGPTEAPADGGEQAGIILIADDLSPSDTLTLDLRRVAGFVTAGGGATSHAAIIARSRGIPAVAGCGAALQAIRDNDLLVLDGQTGTVFVNPDPEVLEQYESRKIKHAEKRRQQHSLRDIAAVTTDGKRIRLLANIATEEDWKEALEQGAEGVGLLRTELLFMGRKDFPTEDEQFIFYRHIALTAGNRPVTIRTLDIGGDKPLPYLGLPAEQNPFLGYRAIRISLDKSDLFLTQLRAILRASAFGKLKILFPMISHVQQVRAAMAFLKQARQELLKNGVAFDPQIGAGIMIEIPSAAIIADLLAKEVDFFSIGTNDLAQYTLAVDRMNEKTAPLYDPFHPAVLRLIQYTVEQAQKNNIPVSLCGEMAADPMAVLLMIGMGLEELSLNGRSIPVIKNIILQSSWEQACSVYKKIMEAQP